MSTDFTTPTLDQAIKRTRLFRERMNKGDWPFEKTKGYFLSKESIERLLDQNNGDTSGLKIYFGENNDSGQSTLEIIVIATVAIDKEMDDDLYIPPVDGTSATGETAAFGATRPCPTWCGKNNVLNQP